MAKNTGYSRQQCCQGLTSGFITSSDSCFNTMSFSVSKSNHFNCCLIAEICRWDLKHEPFGILLLKLFLCCESLTDGLNFEPVVFIRENKKYYFNCYASSKNLAYFSIAHLLHLSSAKLILFFIQFVIQACWSLHKGVVQLRNTKVKK